MIYSDDRGRTWRRGDIAVPNTEDWVNPSETMAVELSNGRVALNVRSESKAHRRLVVTSRDGAHNWSKPEFQPQLVEPICMASLIGLKSRGRHLLLFSNPDNLSRADGKEEAGKNRDRRNVTVKVSYDDGRTWPVAKVIEPGLSGYSDLAAGVDGTIYCLFERGGKSGDHFKTVALTLARFNLDWLAGAGR